MGEKEVHICCICGKRFFGHGNNPSPIVKNQNARCCNGCNATIVIPERFARMRINCENLKN